MKILYSALDKDKVFTLLITIASTSLFLPTKFISISLVLVTVYCLIYYKVESFKSSEFISLCLLALFFFLNLFWIGISENIQDGFKSLETKLPFLLPLCLLFTRKKLSQKDLSFVFNSFVIACVICSIICYSNAIFNIIQNKSLFIDTQDRRYYFFSYAYLTDTVDIDPIYLSLFCNFSILILLFKPINNNKFLQVGLLVYLVIFNLLIASKIGILALFITAFIWIFRYNRSKAFYISLLFAIISGFIISTKIPFIKDRILVSTEFDYSQEYGHLWNSTTYRLAIWACAIEAIKRNPFIGYGTSDGQKALEKIYAEKSFKWGLREHYNPHNEFLSIWLDLGFIGLFVLITILINSIFLTFKTKNNMLLLFICLIIIYCFAESIFSRQKGVVFFSLFYSILLLYVKNNIVSENEVTTIKHN
jgi:O-antigen ligase